METLLLVGALAFGPFWMGIGIDSECTLPERVSVSKSDGSGDYHVLARACGSRKLNPHFLFRNPPSLSASSALPYRRSQPSWSKATPEEVSDQIFKLARRGLGPSQIGVILRDSHGIPQVRFITGNKILRILKSNGRFLRRRGAASVCVWG
jgi:hypothetical protein